MKDLVTFTNDGYHNDNELFCNGSISAYHPIRLYYVTEIAIKMDSLLKYSVQFITAVIKANIGDAYIILKHTCRLY